MEKPGENGEKQLVREVLLLNGMVKENNAVSEEVLFPPKVRVIVQGTKRTPDDVLMQQACLPAGMGIITSYFGVWRRWGYHTGVDVTVPMGTEVLAYIDGTVAVSEWNLWGYGYFVIVDHGDGIQTCYGHNSKLLVEKGQKVKKGQVIALSGNTGTSTGPHVHFEVRKNGKPIDPITFLKNDK